jgi:hypothetical protein
MRKFKITSRKKAQVSEQCRMHNNPGSCDLNYMEATIGDVGLLYKGLGVVGEVSIGGSKQTVDTLPGNGGK